VSRLSTFDRAVFLAMAGLVLALGLLVWRGSGTQAQEGEGPPRVLFLAPDAEGQQQLSVVALGMEGQANEPARLSEEPFGVWDFAVAPDGSRIIYTALDEESGGDLWIVAPDGRERSLLVACTDAVCTDAAWSPDGHFLAFARRNVTPYSSPLLSPPRLWLLNLQSGETAQVFGDGQRLGFHPLWSADGRWLSYLAPDRGGVDVYNLEDGRSRHFTSLTGEPGVWHPARPELLITDMWLDGDRYVAHVLLANPESDETIDLSGTGAAVEDGAVSWSPDGTWIAFGRKELDGSGATPGRQIWRMRADGSQAQALTVDASFDHGRPLWSPDGRTLLFRRYPLKGPEIIPSLWLLDPESGDLRQLLQPGDRPLWMP
jgi:Tol biopolymer transport system component